MSHSGFRYVYGPVPSRRLGRSLGIDLVPFKTCSYDCIYCQLGRTTNKTLARREYVPVEGVLAELAEKLKVKPQPDYISLAGSGEPTLHARIADIIAGIKELTAIPVAVLTNGSLLWLPEVRAALAGADLVIPSLDAGSHESFERINRPHPDISFEQMVDGLLSFAREYTGRIWLEVFILNDILERPVELGWIAAIVEKMKPERVQLNTVSRPPAEESAVAAPVSFLESMCGLFPGHCEVIAEKSPIQPVETSGNGNIEHLIVALVSRRPCTIQGIATGLGLRPNEVLKHIEPLCKRGLIHSERRGELVFYEGKEKR
ncbi:radical SAM protein [bacterium]|nr:radical SAM protein [bacterium]